MLMIEYFSWLCMGFTISQFYFLGKMRYSLGWSTGIASAVSWGLWAGISGNWAVLGLQCFLGVMCALTLRKKAWLEENSGLSRQDMVESDHQTTVNEKEVAMPCCPGKAG